MIEIKISITVDEVPVLGGEVGKMIDEFLEHPETGVRMERPERLGKHRKEKNADVA